MQAELVTLTRPIALTQTSFCVVPLLKVMVTAFAIPDGVNVGFDGADAMVIPGNKVVTLRESVPKLYVLVVVLNVTV